MIKNIKNKLIYALFLSGFLFLNYPGISALHNWLLEGEIISGHEHSIDGLSVEQAKQMLEEAQLYNERLRESEKSAIADAFGSETVEMDQEYLAALNIRNDGVMGTVEIPKIQVYLPIYHGTSNEVLKKGVGHLQGTSLPIGGAGSHAVVSSHRGLPESILFTNLDRLELKDVFYIHVLKETLAYEVDQIKVVTPNDSSDLELTEGADHVTLLTCTPYGINSHRLLVRGKRIPYEETAGEIAKKTRVSLWQWLLNQKTLLISTGILFLFCLIMLIKRRNR